MRLFRLFLFLVFFCACCSLLLMVFLTSSEEQSNYVSNLVSPSAIFIFSNYFSIPHVKSFMFSSLWTPRIGSGTSLEAYDSSFIIEITLEPTKISLWGFLIQFFRFEICYLTSTTGMLDLACDCCVRDI